MCDDWQGEETDMPREKEIKTLEEIKEKLKFYLDTNEENGVVYIPKFFVEKIVYGR